MSCIDSILTDSVYAARHLLGWQLVYMSPVGIVCGYIVETEAYHSLDPASHTWSGESPRNKSMFQNAGTVYVYFTYGRHYCLNIVTGDIGDGQGVLIRAVEPIGSIEIMRSNRPNVRSDIQLTNGPAKLTQAYGIDGSLDGTNIFEGPIHLLPGRIVPEVVVTRRIGVLQGVDAELRFYDSKSPFVSKR